MKIASRSISILFIFSIINYPIFGQNTTNSQLQLLEKSYKEKSFDKLNTFFLNWNLQVSSISDSEFNKLPTIQREAYSAFSAFYLPTHMNRLGGSEWGSDIYKNVNYLIVQNDIKINKCNYIAATAKDSDLIIRNSIKAKKIDTIQHGYSILIHQKNGLIKLTLAGDGIYSGIFNSKDSLIDSITNFRPRIYCDDKLPLYLTSEYEKDLNVFLENKYQPLGTGGIMNPARATGESQKRKEFLEHFIKIWYGHWGGYWQLYSYPEAYSINFDKTYTRAIINFRMVYQGGETILKKENGKWVIVSSGLTWIE